MVLKPGPSHGSDPILVSGLVRGLGFPNSGLWHCVPNTCRSSFKLFYLDDNAHPALLALEGLETRFEGRFALPGTPVDTQAHQTRVHANSDSS